MEKVAPNSKFVELSTEIIQRSKIKGPLLPKTVLLISQLFFQHLRSRTLSLKVIASEEVNLDRDLFLNLGRVQNLSLDMAGILPIPTLPVVIETNLEELGKAICIRLPEKVHLGGNAMKPCKGTIFHFNL